MNEADFLDQLNVPIMGMPKDYVPHFWKNIKRCTNSGFGCNCTANMERIYALKPDLILMTPLHVNQYQELSIIAPTIHYDINFNNGE